MTGPIFQGTSRDTRSKGYVRPPSTRPLLWWSVGLAVVLTSLILGLHVTVAPQVLSPGKLSEHHAKMDGECAQCHQARTDVVDLRCERCHDPAQTLRMSHGAHESIAGPLATHTATHADNVACATCHRDHQGRAFVMKRVDDRECSRCHTTVKSFASHPEFSVVKAAVTSGVGLFKFTHNKHIAASPTAHAAVRASGTTCESCHRPTADRRKFEPMTFENSCSGSACHTDGAYLKGATQPVARTFLVAPGELRGVWGGSQPVLTGSSDVTARNLVHRDRWVLANALRLRQGIDPEGDLAERLSLRTELAFLNEFRELKNTDLLASGELTAAIAAVRQDLVALDARISATSRDASAPSTSLEDLVKATQSMAQQLRGLDPSADAGIQALTRIQPQVAQPVSGGENNPETFERRKLELSNVLAAVQQRATVAADDKLKERAAALQARLDQLTLPAPSSAAVDRATLVGRLGELEAIIQVAGRASGPGDEIELAGLDYLRRFALQTTAGGLGIAEFQAYQTQLLSLLTSIERRAPKELAPRIAALRGRVVAARPGSTGDVELRAARADEQRLLDRLLLEQELRGRPGVGAAPAAQRFEADRREAGARASRLQAQFDALTQVPRLAPAATADARADMGAALDGLMAPCLLCHGYDASGTRLSSVRLEQALMPRSIFNHKPHLTATSRCEDCHASVVKSMRSSDADVPGVAQCQTCHRPGKTQATCATCHLYHPPAAARLIR